MAKDWNGATESYLVDNLSVQCGSEEHWHWILWLGVPCGAIYVFGIPVFGVCMVMIRKHMLRYLAMEVDEETGLTYLDMLYSRSEEIAYEKYNTQNLAEAKDKHDFKKQARKFQEIYSFLVIGYELDHCYWEGMIYLRKIFIGALVVYSTDGLLQCSMAIIGMFVFTVLHDFYDPFQDDLMDAYETFSLALTTMVFMLGGLIQAARQSNSERSYEKNATFVLVALILLWVIVSVAIVFKIQCQKKSEIKEPNEFLMSEGFESEQQLKDHRDLLQKLNESEDMKDTRELAKTQQQSQNRPTANYTQQIALSRINTVFGLDHEIKVLNSIHQRFKALKLEDLEALEFEDTFEEELKVEDSSSLEMA